MTAQFLVGLLLLFGTACGKLVYVQEVFRHGARYPIYPNKHDGTEYAVEEDRVGELTSEGKRMHYLLGQRIFQEYWSNLSLGTTINASQIYVKSTNINRTIESAQSHLMGLLETLDPLSLSTEEAERALPAWEGINDTTDGFVFINNPKYHTLPIHTEYAGSNRLNPGDYLFYFNEANCPNQRKWEDENLKGELARQIAAHPRVKLAIAAMEKAFGVSGISINDVGNYVDNFYCSLHLQRNYSSIFDGEYRKEYDMLRTVAYYIGGFGTDLQVNSTITPYFSVTLENMKRVVKGQSDLRLVVFSSHDMHIANTLIGLRLTDAKCVWDRYLNQSTEDCVWEYPEFTSSVIFELHKNDTSGAFTVRVSIDQTQTRYSGKYMRMSFCNNQDVCTFEQFRTYIESTVRSTYLEDCAVPEVIKPEVIPEPPAPIGLIIPLCLVSALLFLIIVYEVYRFVKTRREEGVAGPYRPNVEEAV